MGRCNPPQERQREGRGKARVLKRPLERQGEGQRRTETTGIVKGKGKGKKEDQHLRPPIACTLSQRSERDCSSPAAQSLRQLGQRGVSRMVSRGAQTPRATTLCSTASDLTLQFLHHHNSTAWTLIFVLSSSCMKASCVTAATQHLMIYKI